AGVEAPPPELGEPATDDRLVLDNRHDTLLSVGVGRPGGGRCRVNAERRRNVSEADESRGRALQLDARTALRRALSRFDGEAERPQPPDGSALPAPEAARGETLAGGELVGRAEDRLRRVEARVPDQVVGRRGREPVS